MEVVRDTHFTVHLALEVVEMAAVEREVVVLGALEIVDVEMVDEILASVKGKILSITAGLTVLVHTAVHIAHPRHLGIAMMQHSTKG